MGSNTFLGDNMIRTEEDDEFARIEHENRIKGQPYHWEVDAIEAAIHIEREECARIADQDDAGSLCRARSGRVCRSPLPASRTDRLAGQRRTARLPGLGRR